MRCILTVLALLAIPAAADAQEGPAVPADADPPVELEQSVTAEIAAPAPTTARSITPEAAERTDAPEEKAAVQDPGSRQWWWIVGAVVVGGVIVALLL